MPSSSKRSTSASSKKQTDSTQILPPAIIPKQRKQYTVQQKRETWTKEEHELFVNAVENYGRDWKKVEEVVKTKTRKQIRSHAQKYFEKLKRSGKDFPAPRAKKRSCRPYPSKKNTELYKALCSQQTYLQNVPYQKLEINENNPPDVKKLFNNINLMMMPSKVNTNIIKEVNEMSTTDKDALKTIMHNLAVTLAKCSSNNDNRNIEEKIQSDNNNTCKNSDNSQSNSHHNIVKSEATNTSPKTSINQNTQVPVGSIDQVLPSHNMSYPHYQWFNSVYLPLLLSSNQNVPILSQSINQATSQNRSTTIHNMSQTNTQRSENNINQNQGPSTFSTTNNNSNLANNNSSVMFNPAVSTSTCLNQGSIFYGSSPETSNQFTFQNQMHQEENSFPRLHEEEILGNIGCDINEEGSLFKRNDSLAFFFDETTQEEPFDPFFN
ncbi:hypothetical protein ABK040_007208 [Willaertia magna]